MRNPIKTAGSAAKKFVRKILLVGHTFLIYRTYGRVFGPPLKRWNPDIIHSHDGVTLPISAKIAEEIGAKLVFDSHELETHRSPPMSWMRKKLVHRMERTNLPKADKVITVTELAADYLANEYKIDRPVVLFNAPPAKLTPMPARWEVYDRDEIRRDLRLNSKDFILVYTGNITMNRGLELVIIALSKVRGYKDPNERFRGKIHFAAVGKVQGGQDEGILQLAKAYGVDDLVHLLPPVAPHRVTSYISSANVAIIPIIPVTLSYELAMPNKLFEGALSGLPIIAADLLEMGPFIQDNKLGMTYSAESPDHCAEQIIEMINNYSQHERSPERQRELEAELSWEVQEKRLLEMYLDMGIESDTPD